MLTNDTQCCNISLIVTDMRSSSWLRPQSTPVGGWVVLGFGGSGVYIYIQ